MVGKVKISNLIYKIMIALPITTLLQGLPGLYQLNRIIVGTLLLLLGYSVISIPKRRSTALILYFFVVLVIWTQIAIDNRGSLNIALYFPTWVFSLLFFYDCLDGFSEWVQYNYKYMSKVILIWSALILISLPFESSYTSTWGDGHYFISFANGEHRLASTALLILTMCFVLYVKYNLTRYLTMAVVPIAAIVMSGARTYLIVLLVIVYTLMISRQKNSLKTIFITVALILISFLLIKYSPLSDKMISIEKSEEYLGFWGAISSGRTNFWNQQLTAFYNLKDIRWLFGAGNQFIYDVSGLWAHNDFINVLIDYGVVGIIVYVYCYFTIVRKLNSVFPLERKYLFLCIIAWFINAMFNMVYTYVCAIIVIPFLHYAVYLGSNSFRKAEISK